MLLAISCSKEPETTGSVIVSVQNQSLSNQEDYFVNTGIVFQESDNDVLVDLGKKDISKGGNVEFSPVELNVGNYYIRYNFLLGNSPTGVNLHKPFQIRAGEGVEVKIIR
jgi:hypothetical protein